MQHLMIWRHAKAVTWTPSADDFSRALQPVGRQHADAVSRWLQQHALLPDCILCSPSQRTRETLEPLLRDQQHLEQATNFLPPLYHASRDVLNSVLDAAFAENDRVMVVGHNPGLESLLYRSVQQQDQARFKRLPTGTLAVISFDPGWLEADGPGRLEHFIRGKHLG